MTACAPRETQFTVNVIDDGIPDPVIFVTPNIPTKASLKEKEKMPKSTHDKIREGEQNTNSISKEIRSKNKRENYDRAFEHKFSSKQS